MYLNVLKPILFTAKLLIQLNNVEYFFIYFCFCCFEVFLFELFSISINLLEERLSKYFYYVPTKQNSVSVEILRNMITLATCLND